jgi:hypothetical protein
MRNDASKTTPAYKYVDLLADVVVPDGFGTVAVIGKNPASADEANATLRRVKACARRLQLSPCLYNLFACRGTARDVDRLVRHDYDLAVGVHNDFELLEGLAADLVIAAWGQPTGIDRRIYDRRVGEVMELVGRDRFVCLGFTSDGYPPSASLAGDPADTRLLALALAWTSLAACSRQATRPAVSAPTFFSGRTASPPLHRVDHAPTDEMSWPRETHGPHTHDT